MLEIKPGQTVEAREDIGVIAPEALFRQGQCLFGNWDCLSVFSRLTQLHSLPVQRRKLVTLGSDR